MYGARESKPLKHYSVSEPRIAPLTSDMKVKQTHTPRDGIREGLNGKFICRLIKGL